MIVCAHLPRFELVAAAGGAEALTGRALAIAPSGSGPARLGEVSGTAQAQGVQAGMMLGEALARCPTLELVPGDPVQVAHSWEQTARALGRDRCAAGARTARACVLRRDRTAGSAWRRGRFDSRDAQGARQAGADRCGAEQVLLAGGGFGDEDAPCPEGRRARRAPVSRRATRGDSFLPPADRDDRRPRLQQLGLGKLGALVRLTPARDRRPLRRARHDSRGASRSGTTRPYGPARRRSSGGVDAARGGELWAAARADSRGARRQVAGAAAAAWADGPAIILSARLVERGTWREEVVFRQALPTRSGFASRSPNACSCCRPRCRFAAGGRGVRARGRRSGRPARRGAHSTPGRLQDAVGQVRTLAGSHAALRALVVDPRSRVPERKVLYAPWQQ